MAPMIKNIFGSKKEEYLVDGKQPTLPDYLQTMSELLGSLATVVNLMVSEGESAVRIQEEIEPLHNELLHLMRLSVDLNDENEERHQEEQESSKFVLNQVQTQLIASKKELADSNNKLEATKKDLLEAEKSLDSNNDMRLMQSKMESLQQKLDNRQERIDNLQNQLEMQDREHQTELARRKAKSLLKLTPASDNERILELERELEDKEDELDRTRDELDTATEDLLAADDQLKEAEEAIAKCAKLEAKLEQVKESTNDLMRKKNEQLREMETEREVAQSLVNETRNIVNDMAQDLQKKNDKIFELEKSIKVSEKTRKPIATHDPTEFQTLRDELESAKTTLSEQQRTSLRDRQKIEALTEELTNMENMVNEYSIDDTRREVDDYRQKLQDATDKIEYQANQIKDQHKRIQSMMSQPPPSPGMALPMSPTTSMVSPKASISGFASPRRILKLEANVSKWKERALGDANQELRQNWQRIDSYDEMKEQLKQALEQIDDLENFGSTEHISVIEKLEKQMEEADEHLEEALVQIERQHEEILEKNAVIRSLQRHEGNAALISKESLASLQDDLEDKRTLVQSLEAQLQDADETIRSLEKSQRPNDLLDASKTTDGTIQDFKRALRDKNSDIESLEMEIEKIKESKRSLKGLLRKKEEEIGSVRADLERWKTVAEKLEKSANSPNGDGKNPENGSEIKSLKRQIESLKERAMSEEEYTTLQEALLHANKSMKKSQKQITRLSQQIDDKNNIIKKLESNHKENSEAGSMVDIEKRLQEYQDEIKDKDATISSLETDVMDAREIRQSLEKKEAHIESLEQKLIDSETAMKQANAKIEAQALEIGEMKDTIELLRVETEDEMTISQNELKALEEGLRFKDSQIAFLEERLNQVEEERMPMEKSELHGRDSSRSSKNNDEDRRKSLWRLESIRELKDRLHKLRKEDNTDAQIHSLERYLEQMKIKGFEDLEHEVKRLIQKEIEDTKAIEEKSVQINQLKMDLKGSEKTKEDVMNRFQEERERFESLVSESRSMKEIIEENETAMFSLRSKLDEASRKIRALEEVTSTSAASLKVEKDDILKELLENNRVITNLKQDLRRTKISLQEMTEELANEKSKNSELPGANTIEAIEKEIHLQEKDNMIKSLEEEINQLTFDDNNQKLTRPKESALMVKREEEISTLRKELNDAQKFMERSMQEGDTKTKYLEEQLQQKDKQVIMLQKDQAEAKRVLKLLYKREHTRASSLTQTTKANLEADLEVTRKELLEEQVSNRKAKKRIQSLENELNEQLSEWEVLENEMQAVNSKVSELESQLEDDKAGPQTQIPRLTSSEVVSVNEYLEKFTKKVVSARKQLEAAHDRRARSR